MSWYARDGLGPSPPVSPSATPASTTLTDTLEPTLSAELIATLVMGVSLAVLQVAQWYDVRRNFRTRCDVVIAEVRRLREDSQDGI